MKDLKKWLEKFKGKRILLIFPHPDDGAYISGGLLQYAQKYSIKTKLLCLTKGGRGILPKDNKKAKELKTTREFELKRSCKILGVDEITLWDYEDQNLLATKHYWLPKLKKIVLDYNPSVIITFDLSGITGHPDHLIVSNEVIKYVKDNKNKPILLLRVPDKQELEYFKNSKAIGFAQKATHILEYSFAISIRKIKAIFAHKSQLVNKLFALQILEWYLFDHRELYHVVDYKKKYPIKLTYS